MKTTILVFCVLLTTSAFGQYGYRGSPGLAPLPDHPAHASYAPIAPEMTVVGGGGYTMAQGERPVSDFPQKPQMSLGDAARELRKQHEHVKKARIIWTNIKVFACGRRSTGQSSDFGRVYSSAQLWRGLIL